MKSMTLWMVASTFVLSVSACSRSVSDSVFSTAPSVISPTAPSIASSSDPNTALAGVQTAAAKSEATGCPAWGNPGGNPGLEFVGLMTPAEAVARSIAQITDAWYAQNGTTEAEFTAIRLEGISADDKNGDGLVCVATAWGDDLNPNSHWARIWADTLSPPAAQAWFATDNHAGTSRNEVVDRRNRE
jgi:hypothetical protein